MYKLKVGVDDHSFASSVDEAFRLEKTSQIYPPTRSEAMVCFGDRMFGLVSSSPPGKCLPLASDKFALSISF